MTVRKNEIFGLIKTAVDAHTMGIHAAAALLRDCGYHVVISSENIGHAMESIYAESSQKKVLKWIDDNNISRIGFSYRLDPDNAVELMGRLYHTLESNGYYASPNPKIKSIFFAGLLPACKKINEEYSGRISTFCGGESAEETLLVMGVPFEDIPKEIKQGCQYDKELEKFGKKIIEEGKYSSLKSPERNLYRKR